MFSAQKEENDSEFLPEVINGESTVNELTRS